MIISLQFTASLLMAFDYFFNEEQRKTINTIVKTIAQPIQDRIDQNIRDYYGYIIQQWAYVATSLLLILISWIGIKIFPLFAPNTYPWITTLVALLLLGLFAGGFPKILEIIVAGITPLIIGGPLRLATWFVIRCPKGSVFGVGFVILLLSFACRFSNLTNQ